VILVGSNPETMRSSNLELLQFGLLPAARFLSLAARFALLDERYAPFRHEASWPLIVTCPSKTTRTGSRQVVGSQEPAAFFVSGKSGRFDIIKADKHFDTCRREPMNVRTNVHSGQLSPVQMFTLLKIAKQMDPQQLAALQGAVAQLDPQQITDLMNILCSLDPTEVPGLLKMAGGG
jgi:hypothetical protein